ncbi:MAG: hypothetical protein JSU86_05305 [Phycisphaerales bacterium]|nr:MAG: hypothetical protein JSU86_05305 [Phycisphaerales bacterium]
MPVTLQRARELFSLVRRKTCCPGTAPAPCIPFLYPDDGCWGRAHEMCRLMIADGASPKKVWIYGSLNAPTQNHPNCAVGWAWHVAPTLAVSTGSGSQDYVIDPSLCDGPVTKPQWKGKQGDSSATLVSSPASTFYRNKSGSITQTDPTYSKTNSVLTTYRNNLKLRCASSHGPPPYLACLTKPPGVQWFGTLGPNQTKRWFTWGWPARWHVFWTVMPLTHCPGAPQLWWDVAVERANATHCTYWITVKNLTASAVRFEGRYDILSR